MQRINFMIKNIEFFKYIKRKYTGNRPTNKVNISFKQEFSFANSSNEIKVGDNVSLLRRHEQTKIWSSNCFYRSWL